MENEINQHGQVHPGYDLDRWLTPKTLEHREGAGAAREIHKDHRRFTVDCPHDPVLQGVSVAPGVGHRNERTLNSADLLRRLDQCRGQPGVAHYHAKQFVTHNLPAGTPAPRAAPSSA